MKMRVIAGVSTAAAVGLFLFASGAMAAEATSGPIRIGVLTDETGVFAAFSGPGSVLAAQMAVEDFGGKVLNRQVEVIEADHQNKADIGSSIARHWLDDGVDAIVDVPNSSVALAVQNLARERNSIMIVSSAGTGDLSNKACSPTTFQWTWDTYSNALTTGKAVIKENGGDWFILGADYAFGHAMATDLTNIVQANGSHVVGSVFHPLGVHDFASFLLAAQASKAKNIALANGGDDTVNALKQAHEFGIGGSGQNLVALAIEVTDIHAIGLTSAQGLLLTTGFYWDRTADSRKWAKRFFDHQKAMPSADQAGVYSAVLQYLKAVAAAQTTAGDKVAQSLHQLPVRDAFAENGHVRADGRMVHDMYLARVKGPGESKYPWDYLQILQTIPGDASVRPLAESSCPLVRH